MKKLEGEALNQVIVSSRSVRLIRKVWEIESRVGRMTMDFSSINASEVILDFSRGGGNGRVIIQQGKNMREYSVLTRSTPIKIDLSKGNRIEVVRPYRSTGNVALKTVRYDGSDVLPVAPSLATPPTQKNSPLIFDSQVKGWGIKPDRPYFNIPSGEKYFFEIPPSSFELAKLSIEGFVKTGSGIGSIQAGGDLTPILFRGKRFNIPSISVVPIPKDNRIGIINEGTGDIILRRIRISGTKQVGQTQTPQKTLPTQSFPSKPQSHQPSSVPKFSQQGTVALRTPGLKEWGYQIKGIFPNVSFVSKESPVVMGRLGEIKGGRRIWLEEEEGYDFSPEKIKLLNSCDLVGTPCLNLINALKEKKINGHLMPKFRPFGSFVKVEEVKGPFVLMFEKNLALTKRIEETFDQPCQLLIVGSRSFENRNVKGINRSLSIGEMSFLLGKCLALIDFAGCTNYRSGIIDLALHLHAPVITNSQFPWRQRVTRIQSPRDILNTEFAKLSRPELPSLQAYNLRLHSFLRTLGGQGISYFF